MGSSANRNCVSLAHHKASKQRSAFSGVSYHNGNNKFIVQGMSTESTYTTSREATIVRAKMLNLEKTPQKRVRPKS